jgi:hypothetical protein
LQCHQLAKINLRIMGCYKRAKEEIQTIRSSNRRKIPSSYSVLHPRTKLFKLCTEVFHRRLNAFLHYRITD